MRQNKTFGSVDQLELALGSDGPVAGFQGLVDATTVSNLAADSVTPTELDETGDYTTNSINTGSLSHTEGVGIKSITAAVNSGLITARASGGMRAVDPANYATDDAAIQTLVDWVETNHDEGTIHCPVRKADGSNLTIENTVATNNTGATIVNFQFHGGRLSQSTNKSFVTTTIDDGSPMFLIRGKTSDPYQAQSAPTFLGGAWNLGFNDATILRMQYINKPEVSLGHVEDFHGDAIVFDTNVFEWRVHHTYFTPDDQQTTPTARCIVLENTLSNGAADDGTIAPSVSTETRHAEGFANVGGATRPLVMGHWEGAAGLANVHCASGQLFVTPATTFQRTTNGADHIRHESGYAMLCPGHLGDASGHGIHVTASSPGSYRIWPHFSHNDGITGDLIHIEADSGGDNRAVIPREEVVVHGTNSTVSYPTEQWQNLVYEDGFSLEKEGTTTISAGGSVTLWGYIDPGESVEVEWAITTDPAADVTVEERRGWNATNGAQAVELVETTGAASVDVAYRVLSNKHFGP